MAYKNAYTSTQFSQNVEDWESLFKTSVMNVGSVKNQVIRILEQKIELARKIETRVLEILHAKTTQELTRRLKDYQKDTLNFSGINLETIFTKEISAQNQQENLVFDKKVRQFIDQFLKSKDIDNYAEATSKKAISYLIQELNAGIKNKGQFGFGGFQIRDNEKGLKGKLAGFRENDYDTLLFTEAMKRRFKEMMAKQGLWYDKNNDKDFADWLTIESNGERIRATFSWQSITENYTQQGFIEKYGINKKSNELTLEGQKKIKEINNKVIQGIINNANCSNKALLESILRQIIESNQFVFLVGKNDKDITGLLGEVAGIYYIHKIMGYETLNSRIQWLGGTHSAEGKKKPHQDILIDKVFGIQVKNTTEQEVVNQLGLEGYELGSANHRINFTNAGLDTVLNRLGKGEQNYKEIIQNYFGMYFFNVPIMIDKETINGKEIIKGFKQGRVPSDAYDTEDPQYKMSYVNARTKLENYYNDLIDFIYAFSSALMFMQVGSGLTVKDQNVLFLIGGTLVVSVVDILEKIKKELNDELEKEKGGQSALLNRSMLIELAQREDSFNIVDFMSSGFNVSSKRKRYEKKQKQSFSKMVISDIVLKSSYLF